MDEQYLQQLWDWTTSKDATFKDRYTFESWSEKLGGEEQYREDFHNWVSSKDATFSERRPFNEWESLVKKKVVSEQPSPLLPPTPLVQEEEAMVSESPTPDGESVVTETELPVQAALGVEPTEQEEPVTPAAPVDTKDLEEVKDKYIIDGVPVSQGEVYRKMNNQDFLAKLKDGTSSIEVMDDPEMEKYIQAQTTHLRSETEPKEEEGELKDIMKQEEESAVPFLNYYFEDKGVSFEETGAGDATIATIRDKEGNVIAEEKFDLDVPTKGKFKSLSPFNPVRGLLSLAGYIGDAGKEAKRLEDWVEQNQDPIKKLEDQKTEEIIRFKDDEAIEATFKEISSVEDGMAKSQNEFVAKSKGLESNAQKLEQERIALDGLISQGLASQEQIDAYNSSVQAHTANVEALQTEGDVIRKEIDNHVERRSYINKSVGRYAQYKDGLKSKGVLDAIATGDILGAAQTALAVGGVRIGAGNLDYLIDGIVELVPRSAIEGVDTKDIPIDKLQDDMKKELKAAILPAAREGAAMFLGGDVPKEYMDSAREEFVYGAILGVAESIPAMIGPSPVSKGKAVKGIGKKIFRYLTDAGNVVRAKSMAAQVTDHLNEEMMSNPNFKDITEGERKLITAPIAIVSGVLENLGFRNIVNKSGLLQDVTMAVLKKSGKKVTAESFEDLVQKEVKSRIARGLLTVGSAGLAEMETGGMQEIADIYVKRMYNMAKDKEMFDTPEAWSKEYYSQVAKSAVQEAIGGMVMGSVGGVVSAANNDYYFDSVSDLDFDMFLKFSKDGKTKSAFVSEIKNKINDPNDPMTKEEGQIQIDQLNQIEGAVNRIPSDYSLKNKRKALSLLMRQDAIKRKIANKDERLTKRERKEIDKIDGLLDKVDDNNFYESEKQEQDAIQEPSTETVDVQEPATDGGPMGEGDVQQGQSTQQGTSQDQATETQVEEEVQPVTEEVVTEFKDTGVVPEPVVRGLAVKTLNGEALTEQEQEIYDAQQEVVDNMASDIAQAEQAAGEGRVDSKGKPIEKSKPNTKRVQEHIRRQARRAKRALSVILPDLNIVLHDKFESLEQAVPEAKGKRGTGGVFDTKNNTIHINLEGANTRTVAHEIFHAAIMRGIKSNEQLTKLTDKMLSSVLRGGGKALNEVIKKDDQGNDVTLKEYLEQFATKKNDKGKFVYEESLQSEEQLAEMAGFLAASYMDMGVNAKTSVKAWIAKAAKALSLGRVSVFSEAMSDKDAIDLLNTIAGATAKGKKLRDLKTIEEVVGLSKVVNKDAGKKGLVRSLIDKVLSKKDKSDIAKEEGIKESEVDDAVEDEVENQINNKKIIKPKTLLQKAAAKIKKALVGLLIVANAINFMSGGDIVSSKSMAYNNIQVESLEGFNEIPLDQGAIDKKNNIEVITESQKDNPKPYVVVDKSTGSAHLFLGDSLITTFEVGVGEVLGDKETKIKSIYINKENGDEVSVAEATELIDGARYLKDGYGSRTNWDDGTKTTGAGIFKVKLKGDIYGGIGFFLETEQGLVTEMALHEASAVRSELLSDGNPDNNRITNGCINFLYESLNEASNNGFGTGSMVFVLPDNPNNQYVSKEGTLRFESSDLDVNRSTPKTKPYVAQPVTFFAGKNISPEAKEFLLNISQYKADIMAMYPSLSNNEYNRLAKIAYGIFGQETSFGTYGGPRGQAGYIKDLAQVELNELGIDEVNVFGIKLPTKNPSVGLTQTRLSSIPKKARDKFNIKTPKDLLNNETSAIATMSAIAHMYVNEIARTKAASQMENIVPLAWSNSRKEDSSFIKALKGDKSQYNNKYVENVGKTALDVSAYIGENPITEAEVSSKTPTDEGVRFQEGGSSGAMFENPSVISPQRQPNGRVKVKDLGAAFDKRAKELGYYIPLSRGAKYTDTQIEQISEAMADDAELQLKKDDSGIGWYDLKTRSAMELMSRIHPELADTNSEAHLKFTLMVALISQNNTVDINFKQANDAYTYYKKNGTLPTTPYAGKSGNIIKTNIALAFKAINEIGWRAYKDLLKKSKTVKDWENMGFQVNGENKSTKITGAMVFLGSKIGSFWGNLNGDFSTLTADLWFSRMFNRYTGNTVSKKNTEKSKNSTLEELKKYKGTTLLYGYNKSDILKGGKVFEKWLSTVVKEYANGNYKDKQRLNVVSNTHFKNLAGSLQDIPRGGNERVAMRKAVQLVQDKLVDRDYPRLDIADIQAIVWYNEKDLYSLYKAVNKSSEKTDYETAAQKVLRGQGINADVALQFQTSKPSADGRRDEAASTQYAGVDKESLSAKFQDPLSNEYTIFNVVNDMRADGYTDSAIALFLSRQINPSTGKRYTKAEVKDAMAIPIDIERSLPPAFGNVEGGVAQGQKLFVEVMTKLKASVKRMLPKTNAKMRAKAHELLKGNPIFKEQSPVMQNKLLVALDGALGTTANKVIQSEISAIKNFLSGVKVGDRQLRKAQARLKSLIRKNLPQAQYKKSEIDALVKLVSEASTENIQQVVDEIVAKVNEKKVEILEAQIEKILKTKSISKQGDRAKGQALDIDFADVLDGLKKDLEDAPTDPDKVQALIDGLATKRAELFNDSSLSNKTLAEIAAYDFAMAYLSTKNMENSEQGKVEALEQAKEILVGFVKGGRSLLKEQLKAAHESYVAQADAAFKDLTGIDLNDIDMDIAKANLKEGQEATEENLRNAYRDYMNAKYRVKAKQRESNQNMAAAAVRKMLDKLKSFFQNKQEDISGLMDIISKSVGDMFGGYMQESVTERIDDASYVFKQGKKDMREMLESNMKRIFGKDWEKIAGVENTKQINTGVVVKGGQELVLSQNQIYYLYNMAKDPANEAAFEEDWGENWKQSMDALEKLMTPQVREWADWQVDEFYPKMYERYNEVYRRVYRTNLPWNQFYAGKIHRDVASDPINMLDPTSYGEYQMSVAGGSTKMRKKSKDPIHRMDGNEVLTSYILEMERFRAFQEVLRDISKMLNNKLVSNAIIEGYGEDLFTLINRQIGLVATGGFVKGQAAMDWVGSTSRFFVFNKIAGNLVVTLKQLTSIPTYANDIGTRNWIASFSKVFANPSNAVKLAKEVYNNSIYIQDRYGQDFLGVIDVYSKNSNTLMPQGSNMSDAIEMITKFGMAFTKAGDAFAIFAGGVPNYAFYKSEFQKKNPTATEQQAIDYAIRRFQKDTKKTQQSGDIQDRDYYQTSTDLAKAMNLFLTTPKQYHRKSTSAYRQLFRKMVAMDSKAGKGTVWENTRTLIMYRMMMPMFFQWVSMGAPALGALSDEEEDDLLRAALLGNVNALFIVGDLIVALKDAITGKPWAGDLEQITILQRASTLIRLYGRLQKTTKDLEKRKELEQAIYVELFDLFLPYKTMSRTWNNWSRMATGEEDFTWRRAVGYSDYVIDNMGEAKKEAEALEALEKLQKELNKAQSSSNEVPLR